MTLTWQISDNLKLILDWAAVGTTVATLATWVPPIAGLFSIAWLATQLYDYWVKKRKD